MDREQKLSERYDLRKLGKRLTYVLVAVAVFFFIKAKFLTPPTVMVASVTRRDVPAEVQGTGTVAVDVLANVGAKIPGRIERVFVDQSDFARKGQIVAQLEDTDIRRQLEDAQARVEAARAKEAAARAEVEAKRASEWQTQRAWDREKHLVATGAVSQEEADEYREQYETAESAVAAAKAEVGAAQQEVAAAESDVRLQEFELSETKIFTYLSGVVVNLPKRPGDAIVPGETVITIADPNLTMVDAFVDQRFSGEIRAGEPATVILRGRENEPLRGRVYRVDPQADPATEEMTVEIAFPLSPKLLEIGQWADAYIQVGEAKNALVVPQSAVMTMANGHTVLVAGKNNKVRAVKIQIVASSPRLPFVAVKGKLNAGDLVLTKPMGIQSGERVRAVQSPGPGPMPAGADSQQVAASVGSRP
jgi:HlyD family secretion protein